MQFELSERRSSRAGAIMLGSSDVYTRSTAAPGSHRRRQSSPCASISTNATAHLAYPAAAPELPAPLAALARDAQRGLVLATAAARTLFVSRGSAGSLCRHRSQPAVKRAATACATTTATVVSSQAASRVAPAPAATATATTTTTAAASTSATTAAAASAAGKQQVRGLQQFVAGGVAGAVSKTLVAPLERVSTMLMADGQRFSLGQAAQHAWSTGLFRGHAATLVKIAPASAIQFAVFHGVKDRILAAKQQQAAARAGAAAAPPHQGAQQQAAAAAAADLANHERLLAGAAAGAASVCACYPLEALRTMMSVVGGVRGNLVEAAGSVLRERGGVAALYRGFRATLVGDMMGNALGFTCYELGCRIYAQLNGGSPAPPHLKGVIGTCSATCVLTLTMPLEVVKRRLQVQGLAGRPMLYRGTLDCMRQILRREGLAGFYAASLPSYLKVAPSIGCMYFLYELLTSSMSRMEARATPAPAPALAPAPTPAGAAAAAPSGATQ